MNDSVDWADLQALLAVARAGSLSAAAREGGVSQPTLSRRIAALEGRLGATLFVRGAGGVRLTDAGREALAQAEAMEAAAARLSVSAAGRAQGLRGVVRVSASRYVAAYLLPGLLAELLEAEPGLEIEVSASDETSNLLLREADVALRMYRPTQDDVIARKAGELALGLFASDAYAARHGLPETPEEMRAHRVLGYDRSDLVVEGFAAAGLPVPTRFFRLRTDDQVVYWEAVRAGAGIGVGQVAVAAQQPGLRRVLPGLGIGALPVWVAAHSELRASARVRRVFDALAEGMGRLSRAGGSRPAEAP
ncbi:MAG: LysR family transcriptional regulator, partial [Pseudomonadota bacterium]